MTLKNVLLLNALSSAATGLGMIVFAQSIAELFGVYNSTPFIGVGIFLVAFAALVFSESRHDPQRIASVRTIIILDVSWVVVSMSIVLFQLFGLSAAGYGLILAVALWVAAMAFLQTKGISQIPANTRQ